jgi:hypothetical protein
MKNLSITHCLYYSFSFLFHVVAVRVSPRLRDMLPVRCDVGEVWEYCLDERVA